MKLYLAGSSKERRTIAAYMHELTRAGHVITHDWVAAMDACPLAEADLDVSDARRYALDDLRGVRAADVVWFLAPETISTGAWVELGYALGIHAGAIIVSGETPSIFARLASTTYKTHGLALQALISGAHGRTT